MAPSRLSTAQVSRLRLIVIQALVFSLLFLVVPYANTSLTPRLTLFRENPVVWHSFAFFVAVFVFLSVGGMAVSIAGMLVACAGLLPPVEGAIFQELIDLAAVLNALRAAVPGRELSDY